MDGPVGVNSLRTYYGGSKDRGTRPKQTRKGGGKIIRTLLQQLEKQDLVKSTKQGRVVTPEGQSYMAKMVKKVKAYGEGKPIKGQ